MCNVIKSLGCLRDEVGHHCPVRPSQLVYPPAVLGRKGTRNPSPLSALSRMRKRCARCDGDAVALERAPWTLVQEWRERVTCLAVTRSKLNGLVGLLYEHYGRSAAGVKRSLIWSCVLCVKQNSRESFDSQEVSCILSPWISQFWCTPRGALFLLRDGGANLRHSSVAERKVRE